MLTLSRNQFSTDLFIPISYEYSLGLFKELDWVEFIWESSLQSYPLLAKINGDGEVVLVMSPSTVFLNNEFINK